jgi:hypothetical protein
LVDRALAAEFGPEFQPAPPVSPFQPRGRGRPAGSTGAQQLGAARTERDTAIVEAYRAGDTMVVIATRHGLTKQRVQQLLAIHAPELERRKPGRPTTGPRKERPPRPPRPPREIDPKYARKHAKTLLRDAVIKLSDRVDAMVADAELRPDEEPVRPELTPDWSSACARPRMRSRGATPKRFPRPGEPHNPYKAIPMLAWIPRTRSRGLVNLSGSSGTFRTASRLRWRSN